MKIAVVGSGISGLSAAYYLSKKHHVDLFEREDHFGGHSYTLDILINEKKITENDLKNYLFKSSSEIRDTLYSSYDIYLSEKYEIKVFQNTIERLKNNFR